MRNLKKRCPTVDVSFFNIFSLLISKKPSELAVMWKKSAKLSSFYMKK